ncbi:uncharacterized protein LOC141701635 [Apium graveolens]|uniref:uncharacterized protein LOC141700575 n=1 Tax=Apium graveolens TaxID=4045 RepID=UPI003D78BC35
MCLLSWNCRGLGNPRAVRVLRDILKTHQPELIFLSETLSVGNKIAELSSMFGFSNFFSVDRQGRGGGIAVMWKHSTSCEVVDFSQNHIDIVITENSAASWRLTCYYGFSERDRRNAAWDFIRLLASKSQLPWCIFGDFNDLLYASDKKGRHPHPQNLLKGFKTAIEDCLLGEIDLVGGKFTWEKGKGTADWVREKLDRAFPTDLWWHMFPLCTLSVTHSSISVHDPIILNFFNTNVTKKQFRFKFENTWLKEPTFHTEVTKFWKELPSSHLIP